MIDPEIFINQKILGSYIPTAEPMAALFFATRKIKKFDIHEILNREILRAGITFQHKVKSGISRNNIEEAKINFTQPKNLFHCLLLNTAPGNLSFDERLDFIVGSYKELMRKYFSFYSREVIRENFINGVQETILLLYTSTYKYHQVDIKDRLENIFLPIDNYGEKSDDTLPKLKPLNLEAHKPSIRDLFIDKSGFPIIINEMIKLNILDANGLLINRGRNKSDMNLIIIKLQSVSILKSINITNTMIVEMLKNDFGDSSNKQHFGDLKNRFNSEDLSTGDKIFIDRIKDLPNYLLP